MQSSAPSLAGPAPPRRSLPQQILASIVAFDRALFEPWTALRCSIAVAVALAIGLISGAPGIGLFGAVGALSVGFGAFRSGYRTQVGAMLLAGAGMSASIFIGSVTGQSTIEAVVLAGVSGFACGMFVALGPAASFVALQSVVAVLVATGFPAPLGEAIVRALLVFAGALLQTMLVVALWPLRRFPSERRALGQVYRSLAGYARSIPSDEPAPPEPHTLAQVYSTFTGDPQPFARSSDLALFRALLDEAERIRTSLAALMNEERRARALGTAAANACDGLASRVARVLEEIAVAIERGRPPSGSSDLWESLEQCAQALGTDRAAAEALLGQLRAARRMTGDPARSIRVEEQRASDREPKSWTVSTVRDALTTLRANFTLRSTVFRHALRLAGALALTSGFARAAALPRGYWLPLTVLVVLKPDFHETFARGVGRVAGTLAGAGLATLLTGALHPDPVLVAAFVLLFAWIGYSVFRASYVAFTVAITAYLIFLLTLIGLPEWTVAVERVAMTTLGGALALLLYALWPTWEIGQAPDVIAQLLEAQKRYGAAVLGACEDASRRDPRRLASLRTAARLARSNAEAFVERLLGEPRRPAHVDVDAAFSVIAAVRRYALAVLALHACVEQDGMPAVPEIAPLRRQIEQALDTLAAAARRRSAPDPLPPLRGTHRALPATIDPVVLAETDAIVDSVNTIASVLAKRKPHDRLWRSGPAGSR